MNEKIVIQKFWWIFYKIQSSTLNSKIVLVKQIKLLLYVGVSLFFDSFEKRVFTKPTGFISHFIFVLMALILVFILKIFTI